MVLAALWMISSGLVVQPSVPTYTPAQVKSDLIELINIFEDVHPKPFWSRSKAALIRDIDTVVNKLGGKNISEPDLFVAAAKMVISIDDPHCWVFVPGFVDYRAAGGKYFPLEIQLRGNRAFVTSSPDTTECPIGAEILRINGLQVKDLYKTYRPLTGQPDDPYGDEFLAYFLPRYLWYFNKLSDNFELSLRVEGKIQIAKIKGKTQAELSALESPTDKLPIEFKDLGQGIGLIDFRACNIEKVHQLLPSIFESIQKLGIKKLVVDDRENSGGGDLAWAYLLEYLTTKPYYANKQTYYRISQRAKDKLGETAYNQQYATGDWEAKAGSEVTRKVTEEDWYRPDPVANKFTGSWVLLSGNHTFSAAMSFVQAVKACHLAPILGEDTGGRATGFGQWIPFTLPNSKLVVAVSSKQFDGALELPLRKGIPPDIRVKSDPTAQRNSAKDPVLKAAITLLNSGKVINQ